MEPKNYIHKFYKDASWSRSVMNKIMPKQNTSIQNNFWIIQVATKGKVLKFVKSLIVEESNDKNWRMERMRCWLLRG